MDQQQLCRTGFADSRRQQVQQKQQGTPKPVKTYCSLSCISKSINSRSREAITPLCLHSWGHISSTAALGHTAQEVLANWSTSRGKLLKRLTCEMKDIICSVWRWKLLPSPMWQGIIQQVEADSSQKTQQKLNRQQTRNASKEIPHRHKETPHHEDGWALNRMEI